MREIKFRIWDKQEGGMYSLGDLADCLLTTKFLEDFGADLTRYEFMQFTGLNDKNGKAIWEGDIVKGQFNTSGKGVVRFGGYMAGGQDYYASYAYGFYMERNPKNDDDTETLSENNEVIGNIYESPELLANQKGA